MAENLSAFRGLMARQKPWLCALKVGKEGIFSVGNAKDITIYTTNTCAYCVMVKKWLQAKGATYNEVNLDENPDRQQEALELSGALTVPVTVVTKGDDSKEVVVGYNLQQLAPALSA